MKTAQYTAAVKESLLLELPAEAEELHLRPGDKVQIQLARLPDEMPRVGANEMMPAVLREIAERQKGRRLTDGSDTDRMLREGRAGAMWGEDPIE